MKIIDLRSDTLPIPPGERDAMYNAEVGDDVSGDDPTVTKLEAYSANWRKGSCSFCPAAPSAINSPFHALPKR